MKDLSKIQIDIKVDQLQQLIGILEKHSEFDDLRANLKEKYLNNQNEKNFQPIAKYLQFATDDPFSYEATNSIYSGWSIHSSYAYFNNEGLPVLRLFTEIIRHFDLQAWNVHVIEESQQDGIMGEYDPVMIMVIHDHQKYQGIVIKAIHGQYEWLIPQKHHYEQGYAGYKSWNTFHNLEDFLEGLPANYAKE